MEDSIKNFSKQFAFEPEIINLENFKNNNHFFLIVLVNLVILYITYAFIKIIS